MFLENFITVGYDLIELDVLESLLAEIYLFSIRGLKFNVADSYFW
jgi:hypothetical protein